MAQEFIYVFVGSVLEKLKIDEKLIDIAYKAVKEETKGRKTNKVESVEILKKQLEGVKRKHTGQFYIHDHPKRHL